MIKSLKGGKLMDNKTRYDLMVKLSDFYIKNVQDNLAGFDKARFIANTSKSIFFSIFILIPLGISGCFFIGAFPLDKYIHIGELWILPSFVPIIIGTMILGFVGMAAISYLEKIDKKNIIQVFKYGRKNITLPNSADEEIKKHLMFRFLEIFGNFSWHKGYYAIDNNWKNLNFIKSLKILNNPISNIDDCITGTYNGMYMKIFDADTSFFKIQYIALSSFLIFWLGIVIPILLPAIFIVIIVFLIKHFTSKGFRGVIVELDMNKNFEGHTFILEKDNIKDNLSVSGTYQKVNLEDYEFEQIFNVYSQNQIEARYILTTAFMERLKKLKEIYKAKYIRTAFKNDKIVILIHTGRDMFQMAGSSKMTKETFVQLFDEITAVLDIIDILKLNKKLGL